MSTHIVILGAGFGGLELTTRLAEELGDQVRITLIDQNDSFIFGFSKLDLLFGRRDPDQVRLHYRDIVKPGVVFKHEHIESIDPRARVVATDQSTYEADLLVVALGADYDLAATPGLVESGNEFYSIEGAERLRDEIRRFDSGVALVAVLGPFFKCPPAPYEAAMMLHEDLQQRGIGDAATIKVLTPLPSPIPISREISEGILSGLARRGIEFFPQTKVTRIDTTESSAVLADGGAVRFDLFLGIPVHRAPSVVEASGLTHEGWIPVDTRNFATAFPNVYAIGDVTSAPVPRAGVFAEGEAATLADHLLAELRGDEAPSPYGGVASCYVEFGGGAVGRADVDFLTGTQPTGRFQTPSLEIGEEKSAFAAHRRRRWFSHA